MTTAKEPRIFSINILAGERGTPQSLPLRVTTSVLNLRVNTEVSNFSMTPPGRTPRTLSFTDEDSGRSKELRV